MLKLALRLACLRLWRAKFPFICQSMAIIAVMVPILIILGLKSGIISGMRAELLSNPGSLEMTFTDSIELTDSRCEEIAAWAEVGFAIPRTSLLASTVALEKSGGGDRKRMDLLPSAPGDPVMLQGGVQAPREGEIVLSTRAAKSLGLAAGDSVTVSAWRNARQEKWEAVCRLAAVLPEKVESRSIVYMPLESAMRVEQFIIDGREGANQPANIVGPAYDAIVLAGESAAAVASLLQENNELLHAMQAGEGAYGSLPAGTWLAGGNGCLITPEAANWLIELANRKNVEAWAWNPPLTALLQVSADSPAESLTVCNAPASGGSCGTCKAPPVLTLHSTSAETATLKVPCPKGGESTIVCQLRADDSVPEGQAWASSQLMALLHASARSYTVWDYRESTPRHPGGTFPSMRIYAASLETAEPLFLRLQKLGYPCRAKLGVIRQLLSLERALDILFALVSGCAALGAAISTAMGLFNATERSLKDYAQLQIMGISRAAQGLFPLVEGAALTLFSFIVSLTVYLATGSLLGVLFENSTNGHGICSLSFWQGTGFLGVSLLLSIAAAVASSIRILLLNPSDTIRR